MGRASVFRRLADFISTPGRIVIVAGVAALVTLLAVTGAGVGQTLALWNSQAVATSSASSATLVLTTENFTSSAFTFRNDSLSKRSSVTVSNTTATSSTTAADLTIGLDSASGSAAIAAAVTVTMWRVALTADCATGAPTGTIRTGSWASFPGFTETALLPAGAKVKYCIDSTVAERSTLATASGSQTIAPRITASIAVGSFAVTTTASTTQQTSYIYPATSQPSSHTWFQIRNAATTQCVDVNGGNNGAGTNLIDFACKTGTDTGTYNQDWSFSTASNDPRYVTIAARYNDALIIGPRSTGLVELQERTANAEAQQWQLQLRSNAGGTNTYQIVNRASGLCLQAPATGIDLELRSCDGTTRQGYTLTVRLVETPVISTLNCVNTTGVTPQSVTLSWSQPAFGDYVIQAQKSGGTWGTIGTATEGSTSYTMPAADSGWSNGNRAIRVVYGTSTLITSQIWKGTTGSEHRLRCSQPTATVAGIACVNTPTGLSFSWSEPAIGNYVFQARNGNGTWRDLGTASADATTFSPSDNTQLSAGVLNMRITYNSTALSSAITSLWKGQLTQNGANVLQCAAPTASFTSLSCVDSGWNGVTIGWGHPALGTYNVDLFTVDRTWTSAGTANRWATSVTVTPANNWADGTRILRVSYGTESATIEVAKSGRANTNDAHVLRCITAGRSGVSQPSTPEDSGSSSVVPPVTTTPTKTAALSGSDGYFLGLLWDAQVVGAKTDYTVLLDGQPFSITAVNEYAKDRLQLYPEQFVGVSVGNKVLEIFDGTTLVISQPLRITDDVNAPSVNRKVFAR
ncbi:ricin-type beta-trefoil lectin protein [Homoserinimonas aerilata]|uniref:Ricin-type beta-trefoil lectin protein n=1 Tax=Homoserinimonas aerilata TaxID=1162970 RepID=A0A542YHU0_9MICO|nr:RICIN domain-containing protein [Homoserinimonas aerilata]TQL47642.1 ricin-type beta-trefoil lectin protein [Homoserinimonas aerilata]